MERKGAIKTEGISRGSAAAGAGVWVALKGYFTQAC